MKTIIQWKQGYHAKCSVESAHEVISGIHNRDGAVSAKAVLEAARPKDSPIHDAIMDRGQKAAAEQYYLENARKMIRSIETVTYDVKKPQKPSLATPTFSAITVDKNRQGRQQKVYESTEEALKDPVKRDEILSNAIRDAIAFRRKYAALQELSQVMAAVDDLVANFNG